MDFKQAWDTLHQDPKFRPRYPDDRVVAWTFGNFPRNRAGSLSLLDIGCGAGRHAIFFAREGYQSWACDFSAVGVEETRALAKEAKLAVETAICEADELVYEDNRFDGAVVYGTFTYLPHERFVRAVAEVRRVLKPGGKALIVTRSVDDARVRNAEKIGHYTYRIASMGEGAPSQAETGMIMTFLDEAEIRRVFSGFARLQLDRVTFSISGGVFVNVDWHIHVEK